VFSIRLDNGTATIIEPRDYAVGTLRVMRGGITIASHAAEGAVPIEILKEDGLCVGFDVGGARVSLSRPESVLVGKLAPGDTVVSLMSRLKRVGLARMFAMIQQQKEPWPLAQGLDDSRVDQVGPASSTRAQRRCTWPGCARSRLTAGCRGGGRSGGSW
jgi:hypothetical protein